MGGVPMTASRSKPYFVRRSRPQDRLREILVPFNDEELAIVEAAAAALGLSVGDFLVMRALDTGKVAGNA
jgi:hypothetical protein